MPATAQETNSPQVYSNQPNFLYARRKYIITAVAILALLGGLAYLTRSGQLTPYILNLIGQNNIVEPSKLPLATDYLLNPLVYEWRGTVEGTVINKTGDHFTINGKGSTLTIFFEKESLTHLWSRTLKREIALTELPIGATVTGSVWLYKDRPENVVGSLFDVENPATH